MSGMPIKTPKQLIAVIVAAFIVPIFIIVLLTQYVGNLASSTEGKNAYTEEAIVERIKPVGTFSTEAPPTVNVAFVEDNLEKTIQTGEQVYNARCAACHAGGLLESPKLGDKQAWASRLSQGLDKLVYSAINGKGSMAAQGGGAHNDEEIKNAVIYLSNKSGGDFN
ncbi:MAG: hypothetical protein CBC60_05435 [Betaproteobacteria bacterium TMED100]|nr:MAG: hypothetical protein CBC60_05435 [Betaproteobacteria bacterium TMED100]